MTPTNPQSPPTDLPEPNPVPYPEGSRCASVRSAPSRGGYPYYEMGVYEAVRRASDGLLTWRLWGSIGYARSTERAVLKDFAASGSDLPLLQIRHGDIANP